MKLQLDLVVVAEFWVLLYVLVTVFDDRVSVIQLLGDSELMIVFQ